MKHHHSGECDHSRRRHHKTELMVGDNSKSRRKVRSGPPPCPEGFANNARANPSQPSLPAWIGGIPLCMILAIVGILMYGLLLGGTTGEPRNEKKPVWLLLLREQSSRPTRHPCIALITIGCRFTRRPQEGWIRWQRV